MGSVKTEKRVQRLRPNERPSSISHKALEEAEPAIDKFARAGYMAKGTVYAVIGVLSVLAAVGYGGGTTDAKGAIATIGAQPFGGVLLLVLALGLAGFTMWRIVQAFADPDGMGSDGKGILMRIFHFAGGIVYAVLAYRAVKTFSGVRPTPGNSEQSITAVVLQEPLGATLVAAAGLLFAAYGIYQWIKAFRKSFTKELKKHEIQPGMYKSIVGIARFGICARGVVFGLIGYFLIRTALFFDPEQTKGLDDALAELAKQPFGRWQLGTAAFGFIAYGLYMFALARYRKTIGKERAG